MNGDADGTIGLMSPIEVLGVPPIVGVIANDGVAVNGVPAKGVLAEDPCQTGGSIGISSNVGFGRTCSGCTCAICGCGCIGILMEELPAA